MMSTQSQMDAYMWMVTYDVHTVSDVRMWMREVSSTSSHKILEPILSSSHVKKLAFFINRISTLDGIELDRCYI